MSYLSLGTDQTWHLHVPKSFYQKAARKTMMIKVGAKESNWRVKLTTRTPDPSDISAKIRLLSRNGAIHAGPFLGILTVQRGSTDFKGNKLNFIDIIQTASELGAFVYVFTVEEINWSQGTTGAFVYHDGTKRWVHMEDLPLPNVVYNRIPYREDEQKGYVQTALNRLKAIDELHLYNSHFFNKWYLYDHLSRKPAVSKFIPDSKLLKGLDDLDQMSRKHKLLYLKPMEGKAGAGIMSIIRRVDSYILKVPTNKGVTSRSFPTIHRLWNYLRSRTSEGYVVQQGVVLLRHDNKPFDIRVLVQKDENGLWQLSGVGIRVAGENGITTHVPRGGSIASPEQVLIPLLGQETYQQRMRELKKVVLEIANTLSEHDPTLGEMSMDIGLTKEGSFWFFEANAKPMKFDEPHIRRTSLMRIIQYTQYLSNFRAKGENLRAGQANHT